MKSVLSKTKPQNSSKTCTQNLESKFLGRNVQCPASVCLMFLSVCPMQSSFCQTHLPPLQDSLCSPSQGGLEHPLYLRQGNRLSQFIECWDYGVRFQKTPSCSVLFFSLKTLSGRCLLAEVRSCPLTHFTSPQPQKSTLLHNRLWAGTWLARILPTPQKNRYAILINLILKVLYKFYFGDRALLRRLQRSTCFCLPSYVITGVCCHVQPYKIIRLYLLQHVQIIKITITAFNIFVQV